jgi:hypothetical protein
VLKSAEERFHKGTPTTVQRVVFFKLFLPHADQGRCRLRPIAGSGAKLPVHESAQAYAIKQLAPIPH